MWLSVPANSSANARCHQSLNTFPSNARCTFPSPLSSTNSMNITTSSPSPSTTTYSITSSEDSFVPELPYEQSSYFAYNNNINPRNTGNTNNAHQYKVGTPFTNCATISKYVPSQKGKTTLKESVFISKESTHRLAEYIVKEEWGKDNGLLYKYFDYIFRCQVFDKEAVIINKNNNNNDRYFVFHTGLQRRHDLAFLYAILVQNKREYAMKQEWRVNTGSIKYSLLSTDEVVQRFGPMLGGVIGCDWNIPKQSKFYSNGQQMLKELLFDEEYVIEDINWKERILINKDRIYPLPYTYDLHTISIAFEKALQQTLNIAVLNPRIGVPQGFIDTKHRRYRRELLLPLNVEYPLDSGQVFKFALAIAKSKRKKRRSRSKYGAAKVYIVKSLLTMEMAYANARLVGQVDSSWLKIKKKR